MDSVQRWQIHFPERRGKKLLHGHTTWQLLKKFQREADRLDLQHHVLCLTFNSKLYFSPIEKPRNALDVGTGTGIWAIDLGMYLSLSRCSDMY